MSLEGFPKSAERRPNKPESSEPSEGAVLSNFADKTARITQEAKTLSQKQGLDRSEAEKALEAYAAQLEMALNAAREALKASPATQKVSPTEGVVDRASESSLEQFKQTFWADYQRVNAKGFDKESIKAFGEKFSIIPGIKKVDSATMDFVIAHEGDVASANLWVLMPQDGEEGYAVIGPGVESRALTEGYNMGLRTALSSIFDLDGRGDSTICEGPTKVGYARGNPNNFRVIEKGRVSYAS